MYYFFEKNFKLLKFRNFAASFIIIKMSNIKSFLKRKNVDVSAKAYLLDALGAMALGLFASLLIGTIFDTIGNRLNIPMFVEFAKYCKIAAGPAMGVAIAYALHAPALVMFSAVAVGVAGNTLGGPVGVLVAVVISTDALGGPWSFDKHK